MSQTRIYEKTEPLSSEEVKATHYFECLLELFAAWEEYWQEILKADEDPGTKSQAERRLLAALHAPERDLPEEERIAWHSLQKQYHQLMHRLQWDPKLWQEASIRSLWMEIHGVTHSLCNQLLKHSQRLSEFDELTGLPNRRQFQRDFLREQALVDRGESVFVAIIDVDHFKAINDRHGHLWGDRLLQAVAHKIRQTLRGYDGFYRFGGDEFLALLPKLDAVHAQNMGDRLCAAVRSLQLISDSRQEILVTLSIGMAPLRPGEDPEKTLDQADQALYQAKHEGRDRAKVVR